MHFKFNLKNRIYLALLIMVSIALITGSIMFWYILRMQVVFDSVMQRHLAAYETAAYLENALINQRGFVTYYFLDGDPKWLAALNKYRSTFKAYLNDARKLELTEEQAATLNRIVEEYAVYIAEKDQVIALYKLGKRQEGSMVHQSVRQTFFDLLTLCETFKQQHHQSIQQAYVDSTCAAVKMRFAVVATIVIQVLLVLLLGALFLRHILTPVYQMLVQASGGQAPQNSNVISELSSRVDHLLKHVDLAQDELEKSRENLLQAEKMALVGRLAAGMAHSIRNPFTSVKMRLFTLSRSLQMNAAQAEDFEVISNEIRHIDTIVQNFLEFSRPPKLVTQLMSPSTIVDNALRLLSHRLKSYAVTVAVIRSETLPEVLVDPEQIKEVIVNLIINACEEIKQNGQIRIDESIQTKTDRHSAIIRICDSGAGIPDNLKEDIFQPFFTTKEEGTGLGLSIAARIVKEHGGNLTLTRADMSGACFVLALPLTENRDEYRTDSDH